MQADPAELWEARLFANAYVNDLECVQRRPHGIFYAPPKGPETCRSFTDVDDEVETADLHLSTRRRSGGRPMPRAPPTPAAPPAPAQARPPPARKRGRPPKLKGEAAAAAASTAAPLAAVKAAPPPSSSSGSSDEDDVWMARAAARRRTGGSVSTSGACVGAGVEAAARMRTGVGAGAGAGAEAEAAEPPDWVGDCVQHPHRWRIFQRTKAFRRAYKGTGFRSIAREYRWNLRADPMLRSDEVCAASGCPVTRTVLKPKGELQGKVLVRERGGVHSHEALQPGVSHEAKQAMEMEGEEEEQRGNKR